MSFNFNAQTELHYLKLHY